jgi:uncharacterized protein (TIRG00374 family)
VPGRVFSLPWDARYNRPWQIAAGLALGVVLLVLAARGVELGQVRAGLVRADPLWVAAASLCVLLATAAKIRRWQGLFPDGLRPGLWAFARAFLIGQMANALFPARVGDVARAYILGRNGGGSKAVALGTVAAEKGFDAIMLLLCGIVVLLWVPLPTWLNVPLAGLTAGGLLLGLVALAWSQGGTLAWVERWAAYLPWGVGRRAAGALRRALAGLNVLRQPRRALGACLWSLAIWCLAAGTNYALFLAFGLRLPAGAALLLLFMLYIGAIPPSTPGKLGVFHSVAVLGLEACGVERSASLLYASVLYLIVYLPQIVPGAILLGIHSPIRRQGKERSSSEP